GVDLPEGCKPLPDLLVWKKDRAKRRLAFDILVERNLGAGQQAHRNMRRAGRRKTAGDRNCGIWSSPACPRSWQAGSRHGADYSHTSKGLLFLWKAGMVGRLNKPPQGVICRMLSQLASTVAISSPRAFAPDDPPGSEYYPFYGLLGSPDAEPC